MNTKLIFLLLLALFSFAASQETNLETGELETSVIENEETPTIIEQENQENETITPSEELTTSEEFTEEFIEEEEDNEETPIVVPVEEEKEDEVQVEEPAEDDGIWVEIPTEALAPTLPELGGAEEDDMLDGESLKMYLSTIVLCAGLFVM